MSSWRVTISSNPDVVITPSSQEIQTISISHSNQQAYSSASFDYHDFSKSSYVNCTIGTEVTIEINDVLMFEGFIASRELQYAGDCIILKLICVSNTFMLQRYFTDANKTYTDKKTGYIVKDLLTTYTSMVHDSISTNDGVTVASIVFDAVTLASAFEQLSELDGYMYYVGSERLD